MTALERLRAERAAQDARMAAMWKDSQSGSTCAADKPKAPTTAAPPSDGKKKETGTPAAAPPKQRYSMKGD